MVPNPCRDRATVGFALPGPGGLTLKLYDATGRMVLGRRLVTKHSDVVIPLDLRALSSGVYVVSLESGGQAVRQTLTVQH